MMNSRLFAMLLSAVLLGASVTQIAVAHRAQLRRPEVPAAGPIGNAMSLTLFARGTTRLYNPDPIVVRPRHVYVSYQNATQPTGTGGDSTIVSYDGAGKIVAMVNLPGRCDGLRYNPYTKTVWATVNEDANPGLFILNPLTLAAKAYTFAQAPPHGGGYDDMAFVDGKAFVAASNPLLNAAGKNVHPALDEIVLRGTKAYIRPVLMGDATALDLVTHKAVTLNLTDPDSISVTPSNQLLLVSQADSEIVFITNPGTTAQMVARLSVGTQLDDTLYTTGDGALFIVDTAANRIYRSNTQHFGRALYTEAPSDSGVAGFVGTIDPSTGTITPNTIGFGSPSGLYFAPIGEPDDGT